MPRAGSQMDIKKMNPAKPEPERLQGGCTFTGCVHVQGCPGCLVVDTLLMRKSRLRELKDLVDCTVLGRSRQGFEPMLPSHRRGHREGFELEKKTGSSL